MLSNDVFRTPKRSKTVVFLGRDGVTMTPKKFVQTTHNFSGSIPQTAIYTFSHFRITNAKKSVLYTPLSQNQQNFTFCFVKRIKIVHLFRTARGAKWLISPKAISMSHAQTPFCQTFVIAKPVPLITVLTGGHL
jgi:hypothetical protein